MLQHAGAMIDHVYGNEYVTFGVGVSMVSLIVFVDKLDRCDNNYFWGLTCLVFLATLLMYDSNPMMAVMLSAFVIAASRH